MESQNESHSFADSTATDSVAEKIESVSGNDELAEPIVLHSMPISDTSAKVGTYKCQIANCEYTSNRLTNIVSHYSYCPHSKAKRKPAESVGATLRKIIFVHVHVFFLLDHLLQFMLLNSFFHRSFYHYSAGSCFDFKTDAHDTIGHTSCVVVKRR